MAGNVKIKVTPGCDADEATMELSGTAEPNGGDHIAYVYWGGIANQLAGLVSVQLFDNNVWIEAPSYFLFTSAGETYTLRVRGLEHLEEYNLQLLFPYTVTAVYAPAWAAVEDLLVGSIDDEPCCIVEGEDDNAPDQGIHGSDQGSAGGYATDGDCATYDTTVPYSFNSACIAGEYLYGPATYTPTVYIYDWLNKEFSTTLTIDQELHCEGVTGVVNVAITVTKVKDEGHLTFNVVKTASAGGTGDNPPSATPQQDSAITDPVTFKLPCSDWYLKLTLYSTFNLFLNGCLLTSSHGLYLSRTET